MKSTSFFNGLYRPVLTSFFFLVAFTHSFAQTNQLKVDSLMTDAFPQVSLNLWVRDPDGIETNNITISEDGKKVQARFIEKKINDSVAGKKCLVFLLLNPGAGRISELNWYKQVIRDAIQGNVIHKGDKIDILDFNHQNAGQVVYPEVFSFTDDLREIENKLDLLQARAYNNNACANGGSLVLPAINKALLMLREEHLTIPAGIVVLSDDRVCVSNNLVDAPGTLSKTLNIPVYGIVNNKGTIINSIRDLCNDTHGLYCDEAGDPVKSAGFLNKCISDFTNRHAGLIYSYRYTSELDKDGKTHAVRVDYNNELSTAAIMLVPGKNILEWTKANPFIAGGIVLFLLIAAIMVFLINKKNKEKKELEKVAQNFKLQEIERLQAEKDLQVKEKIEAQQNELNRMQENERQQKLAQEMKVKEEMKKKEAERLTSLMRMRGNFPWLDFTSGGQPYHFEMSTPDITIGRSADCNIQINSQMISKKHCRIYFDGQDYFIEDLNSTNGVLVNKNKVTLSRIVHGSAIQLGDVVMNFHI